MPENSCRHIKCVGINASLEFEDNEDPITGSYMHLQAFNKVCHQKVPKEMEPS